ncbi:homeobox protein [Apis cerana cerana]|uniref:Homeobox protein n=1 Tax=Apis cerana cerana TaxID=94128 RepID=A0A2A3E4R5_APICC|nr:homeobox protein [Apis cerana cerana]
MMGSKGLHGAPITAPGCFPSGRYSPPPYRAAPDPMPPPPRRCMPNPTGDLFGGLNSGLQDGLLSRAEALAADLGKHNAGTPMPLKHDPVSVYHHGAHMPTPHPNNRPHHQRIGGVRREVQAEAHQAGRDAGGRGQGVGELEVARCRRAVPVDDMPVRVPHVVPQQHDRKRSLEAYFAVQPRPSGEKIAAIAEKLDLKKNVVRVWFCNQRQKQKRMKFAAQH